MLTYGQKILRSWPFSRASRIADTDVAMTWAFSARAVSTKFVFESKVVTSWSTVMVRSKLLL